MEKHVVEEQLTLLTERVLQTGCDFKTDFANLFMPQGASNRKNLPLGDLHLKAKAPCVNVAILRFRATWSSVPLIDL